MLSVSATACESTEDQSARIGREGTHLIASAGTVHVGKVNHGVRVSGETVLSGAGRTAVAVQLTSTTTQPQVDVPVLIYVLGAGGKQLYSNDTGGLESNLQQMPLLRPGQSEWWVNDQVLTTQAASTVRVRVGDGTGRATRPIPSISVSGTQLGEQAGVSVLTGSVVNHSAVTEHGLPIFAVALRSGRITAAGRAVIPLLPGNSTTPAAFLIFLVGNPAGSSIQVTAAPTAL